MDSLEKSNVVYVSTEDDLRTVLSCFTVNEISHVPVLVDEKVVGMISKTDVVEYLYDNLKELEAMNFDQVITTVKAKEIMIQPLIQADVNDTERTLLEKMTDHQVSSVVIKNAEGRLLGIVTEKDMIKYFAGKKESDLSFSETIGLHMVQWLNDHGLIRASKVLADIGI